MATIPESAIDSQLVLQAKVAILGYGNQGRAHALNLRDQGVSVVVGQRPGSGFRQALEDGFEPVPIAEATQQCDWLMLSLPDGPMPAIYREQILPFLRPGQLVLLAHGFNVVYQQIEVPETVDLAMVSPKGVGAGVRRLYEEGKGVPALIAVHQDYTGQAESKAIAYAWGIGCARSGLLLRTTFRTETVSDLFGEQTVLCGGIPRLVRLAFETLVAKGYDPEIAYFECVHETKLIVDLIVERGLSGMRSAISDTAAWGGLKIGAELLDTDFRIKLGHVLDRIEDGSFASEWIQEQKEGLQTFYELQKEERDASVETIGRDLRSRML